MKRPLTLALSLLALPPHAAIAQTFGRSGGAAGDAGSAAASVESNLGAGTIAPVTLSVKPLELSGGVVVPAPSVLDLSAKPIVPTALGTVVMPSASKEAPAMPDAVKATKPPAAGMTAGKDESPLQTTQPVFDAVGTEEDSAALDGMFDNSAAKAADPSGDGFFARAGRFLKGLAPFGGAPADRQAGATFENVRRSPSSFQALTGTTLATVEEMAGSGRLRLVDVKPGAVGTLRELPVRLVPGRYYVAVKTKDGLVLADYPLQHGGHRKLTMELGLPAPRKLEAAGTPVGGVIFYDDGVVVSGQALRYPSDRNASDLARALKKMGFKILEKRAGPIRGPNSSPTGAFDARNIPLGL